MRYVGVDGCLKGWFFVSLDDKGGWEVGIIESMAALWQQWKQAELVLVDIPIGLRDSGQEERQVDKAARKLLGQPRGSSVFPAPCRAALRAADYQEAARINREVTGRGLSLQSWNIMGKIWEVDELLQAEPGAQDVLREAHPEVTFWGLNGGSAMRHNKKRDAGLLERLLVLERYEPRSLEIILKGREEYRRGEAGRDDIVDALALAVSAQLGQGKLKTIPARPPMDARGLRMEMVYFEAAEEPHTPNSK